MKTGPPPSNVVYFVKTLIFSGTYRLHFQDRREEQTRRRHVAIKASKEEEDMFLRGVEISLNYIAIEPRNPYYSTLVTI
jgi:hypothetical protein